MYTERIKLYEQLEQIYGAKVLMYFTSDRPNAGGQIADDAIDYFISHLEKIGYQDRLVLYIYTRGGFTSSAWSIVNLLRMYCNELFVVVPHKCHSAGTLICLGSNKIIMTRYATLGPIDPTIVRSAGKEQEQNNISVEDVDSYIRFGKEELSIKNEKALLETFMKLSDSISPTTLGRTYRVHSQIQMLADKLLDYQVKDKKKKKKIISFLCSESGSHDYTIYYNEAKQLGLNVVLASEEEENIIKQIYADLKEEVELLTPFAPEASLGFHRTVNALIESIPGGSDCNCTEGQTNLQGQNPNVVITFNGWQHSEEAKINKKIAIKTKEKEAQYEIVNDESV